MKNLHWVIRKFLNVWINVRVLLEHYANSFEAAAYMLVKERKKRQTLMLSRNIVQQIEGEYIWNIFSCIH